MHILDKLNKEIERLQERIDSLKQDAEHYSNGTGFAFFDWMGGKPHILKVGDKVHSKYGEHITITDFKGFIGKAPKTVVGVDENKEVIEIGYDRLSL